MHSEGLPGLKKLPVGFTSFLYFLDLAANAPGNTLHLHWRVDVRACRKRVGVTWVGRSACTILDLIANVSRKCTVIRPEQ